MSSSVLVDTRAAVIRATTHWSVNKQVLNQRTGGEKILVVLEVQRHYSHLKNKKVQLGNRAKPKCWSALGLIQGKALLPTMSSLLWSAPECEGPSQNLLCWGTLFSTSIWVRWDIIPFWRKFWEALENCCFPSHRSKTLCIPGYRWKMKFKKLNRKCDKLNEVWTYS